LTLGTFTDPGTGDTHSAVIDWGDGTPAAPAVIAESGGSGSIRGTHAYATPGFFTITVTLTDDDAASAVQSTPATIAGVSLVNGIFKLIGTSGTDIVVLYKLNSTLTIHAVFDFAWCQSDDDWDDEDTVDQNWSHYSSLQYRRLDVPAAGVQSIEIGTYGGHDFVWPVFGVGQSLKIDGGEGNDWLVGGSGNDTITDLAGNNRVYSGSGNDVVTTGPGRDRIWTDGGDDTVSAGDGNNEIHTDGGNDVVTAGVGSDEIWSGEGNDSVTDAGGHNTIYTEGGDDLISLPALSGNDVVFAGTGNDTVIDGGGDNCINTDGGNDTVTSGGGKDTIDAGSGNDVVRAGGGNDTLDGGDGHDILLGGDGNDTLNGGDGMDLAIGGIGADKIIGNAEQDILIAGYTSFDANDLALAAILTEWTSGRSLSQRIYNLSQGTAASGLDGSKFSYRANGTTYLIGNDGATQTVFNDNDVDTLTGSSGSDWFLANKTADNGEGSTKLDKITDLTGSDTNSDTDF